MPPVSRLGRESLIAGRIGALVSPGPIMPES
jgi:hypothetical protein